MEILKFKPILHEKIWGGTKLFELLNKGDGTSKCLGESWEVSDNESGHTCILGGDFDGQTLSELIQKYPKEILGERLTETLSTSDNQRFPLLCKYIDASDDLSVQVHPGDNSPLGDAKTEAWYVVDAPKNANIIVGIASNLPETEIVKALKSDKALDVLNKIPVETGDVLLIPAGTVHAITKGLVVYEVQQNSDTTFRLYDWGRVDSKGKPRELHLKEAEQVIDFTVHTKHKIMPIKLLRNGYTETFLTVTKYFALKKYSKLSEDLTFAINGNFHIITCLKGHFILTGPNGEVSLSKGETILIPAQSEPLLIRDSQLEGEFISCFVPNIEKDILQPLLAEGYTRNEIESLGGRPEQTW